jgi:hypothetical protein
MWQLIRPSVCSQSVSGLNAVNPLVAFYTFFLLPRTSYETNTFTLCGNRTRDLLRSRRLAQPNPQPRHTSQNRSILVILKKALIVTRVMEYLMTCRRDHQILLLWNQWLPTSRSVIHCFTLSYCDTICFLRWLCNKWRSAAIFSTRVMSYMYWMILMGR